VVGKYKKRSKLPQAPQVKRMRPCFKAFACTRFPTAGRRLLAVRIEKLHEHHATRTATSAMCGTRKDRAESDAHGTSPHGGHALIPSLLPLSMSAVIEIESWR
jgi:hypothetical protein